MKNNKDAKIITGFKCNNFCLFCYDKKNRYLPEKKTAEVKNEIFTARKKGAKKLHLIGGEPTIRTDILDLIRYAKTIGFDYIMITTNGRMFAYSDFTKQLIKTGISEIIFSIHGYKAKIHDFLTKSRGSFNQIQKGLYNLKEFGFNQIGVNTTIVRQNYKSLPLLAIMLNKYKIKRAEFIWVATTKKKFKELTPLISRAAPYICQALDIGNRNRLNWALLNPAMGCYFSDYFNSNIKYGDSREEKLFSTNPKARTYYRISKMKILNYMKKEICHSCLISRKCLGVEKTYSKIYGTKEIKPVLTDK